MKDQLQMKNAMETLVKISGDKYENWLLYI